MVSKSLERLFEEAVAWVQAELDASGMIERAPREAWLEALSDEYVGALRERRGMDPGLVRLAVQALIDQTPSKGKPWNLDPVEGYDGPDKDRDASIRRIGIWRFRGKGRPPAAEAKAADLVFLVGAVNGYFGLRVAGATDERRLYVKSASRAVAEALRRRGFHPQSPRRVVEVLGQRLRAPHLQQLFEEGLAYGRSRLEERSDRGRRRPTPRPAARPGGGNTPPPPVELPPAEGLELLGESDFRSLLDLMDSSEKPGVRELLETALERRRSRAD